MHSALIIIKYIAAQNLIRQRIGFERQIPDCTMDYDLFQSDDEEILATFIQATQKQETLSAQIDVDDSEEDLVDGLHLPEFNCSGRDTLKSQLCEGGFLGMATPNWIRPALAWIISVLTLLRLN